TRRVTPRSAPCPDRIRLGSPPRGPWPRIRRPDSSGPWSSHRCSRPLSRRRPAALRTPPACTRSNRPRTLPSRSSMVAAARPRHAPCSPIRAQEPATRGRDLAGSRDLPGHELERDAVVAPPLPRGLRAVVEHVTLMAAATDAVILRARHQQGEILLGTDVARNRREEARPAGPAV